jgi:hypothetical protein
LLLNFFIVRSMSSLRAERGTKGMPPPPPPPSMGRVTTKERKREDNRKD